MSSEIKRWLTGYVTVYICGYEKERFVTLCKNNDIYLFNVRKNDNKLYFSIDLKSYRNIKKIVRKTHIIPCIEEKCGLPFIYGKYKNRKSFIIGVVISFFLFYLASMYVWNISVDGENYYTESEIIRFLKLNNIHTGIRIKDIECNKVERLIRSNYNDIGWVSVKIEGTYMVISLKENVKYNFSDKKEKGCHLIAPQKGIIKSVYVKKGELMVNKGEEINKGDIIISGVCNIMDDGGNILEKQAVNADGDVILQYDKEYFYEQKREYVKRNYTNKKRKIYKLWWDNKEWINVNLYQLLPKKFDNYDVMVNNYNVVLGKKLCTPITIIQSEIYEYKNEKLKYTDKELNYKAKQYYKRYIGDLKKDNKIVVDSNIVHTTDLSGLYSKGYVTIEEKITSYKEIDNKEMLVETKINSVH